MELTFRGVNDAFRGLVKLFHTRELGDGSDGRMAGDRAPVVSRPSRNGNVLRVDEPVLITYEKPLERVLFNQARDANPTALLYEAMWMLAGRNDVEPLAYYTRQFREYSDDGETLNGAYGYRWRHARFYHPEGQWGQDQLEVLIDHLKADPNSRRAVLQMWEVESDLLKIGPGEGTSRDVCCNLSVMFSLRETGKETMSFKEERHNPLVPIPGTVKITPERVLDITVTNRSNDLVWGLLAANYTCFSVLAEYMAARLGVGVGKYHHFTNNLHCYIERKDWSPVEWLADETPQYETFRQSVPLIRDVEVFEREMHAVVNHFDGTVKRPCREIDDISEPFLRRVACPVLRAFELHRIYRETEQAIRVCEMIDSDDWKYVCKSWLERRRQK